MVSEDFSVWEISGFDLPDITVDSGELYHQADSIPPLRSVVEITSNNKELFYSTWEKNTKIIEEQVKTDSIDNLLIDQMWKGAIQNFKWHDRGSVRILSDKSKYIMTSHFDNRLIFGVLIINLIDNKDSTEFENGYTAPTKKGTGIFMLNNNDLHRIQVTTDRLIGYQTLSVKDCLP
jgi:hypothetical protein